MLLQRSTGWTIDGQALMEQSGRQIAEEMFRKNGIICRITQIGTDGTCGGHWCFYVNVELDQANADKWDRIF